MQNDKIYIRQLTVDAVIGCLDWERKITQRLVFDLTFTADVKAISLNDDLTQGIDYAKVCERVTDFVANSEYKLIETLAEAVAALLLKEFSITWCEIKCEKPGAIPNAATVGVAIERGA